MAWRLAYQPELGHPWVIVLGQPVYRPWTLLPCDFHIWRLLKGVILSTLLGVGSELQFSGETDLVKALRQSAQQNDMPTLVLQEIGGWEIGDDGAPLCAHVGKHLQPYADQLIFEGKTGHIAPERALPCPGYKNGHSQRLFALKVVAGADLSN